MEPSQTENVATSKTIGTGEIHAAVERLAQAISRRHPRSRHLVLLGIANGGVELARRLALILTQGRVQDTPHGDAAATVVAGTVDISFHRDDIGRHPIPKEFAPTQIPADVHGATIVLVDDVLFSGRTVKAALDELFDHGRPAKVELAVLVDRGGRLLPVAADYTGLTLAPERHDQVVVHLHPKDSALDRIEIRPRNSEGPSTKSQARSTPSAARTSKARPKS